MHVHTQRLQQRCFTAATKMPKATTPATMTPIRKSRVTMPCLACGTTFWATMTVGEGVGRGVGARYTMMVYSPVEQLAADRVRGRDDRLKL